MQKTFLAKHANQFEVSSPYVKKIDLYGSSAADVEGWVKAIEQCIDEASRDAEQRAREARKADGKRVDDRLLWASSSEDGGRTVADEGDEARRNGVLPRQKHASESEDALRPRSANKENDQHRVEHVSCHVCLCVCVCVCVCVRERERGQRQTLVPLYRQSCCSCTHRSK